MNAQLESIAISTKTMTGDISNRLREALQYIAIEGAKTQCTEYGIYLNRGEAGVVVHPSNTRRPLHITCDLYSHIVDTHSPLVEKCLDIDPALISKIYYHEMNTELGIMVIGILTAPKSQSSFILEHVK